MKLTTSQLRQIIQEEIQKLNRNNPEVMEEGFWKDLALLGLIGLGGLSAGQAARSAMGQSSLGDLLVYNPPAKIVQSITKDAAKNDMQGIEDDAQVLQSYIEKLAAAFNKGEDPEKVVRLSDEEERALSNIQQSLKNSPDPQAQKVLDVFQSVREPVKGFKGRTRGAFPPGQHSADATDAATRAAASPFGGQFK